MNKKAVFDGQFTLFNVPYLYDRKGIKMSAIAYPPIFSVSYNISNR